jgi:mono/diheme cytochrome c family protein
MRRGIKTAILVLAGLFLLAGYLGRPQLLDESDLPRHAPDAVNGEYFFHAGGCASCHGESLEGGVELESPYGIFRAPNITPDREAGIGGWTALEFVNAMVHGTSPGGRHYYPAFPYTSYARMRLEDVIDLKAYLDSLPPNGRPNEEHDLAFPWNIRFGLGWWKRLFLDSRPVAALPEDNPQLQRGRYLAEGAGHCGECHTPRNGLGGLKLKQWLSGGPNPEGKGRVPNLTPAGKTIADWSSSDIAYYLESGFTPDFDMVGGSMVKVQENMARLSDADRAAIAAYLKALPPVPASGN